MQKDIEFFYLFTGQTMTFFLMHKNHKSDKRILLLESKAYIPILKRLKVFKNTLKDSFVC